MEAMPAGLASHTGCKSQGYISMCWTGGCSTCLSAQSHRLPGRGESEMWKIPSHNLIQAIWLYLLLNP